MKNKSVIWIPGIEGFRGNIQLHREAGIPQMGIAAGDIRSINLPGSNTLPLNPPVAATNLQAAAGAKQ